VIYLLDQRRNDLTLRYLSAQRDYNAARQEALQNQVRYEAATRQISAAVDPDERAKLRQEMNMLQSGYTQSLSKVNAYQLELNDIKKSQDFLTSNNKALLNQNQDLQKNLNNLTAERDKLRSELASASAPKPADPALVRRNEELQARLADATDEINRLRAAPVPQRPAAVRPTFIVLPQDSVLRLSAAPFSGNVALGVGNVHDDLARRVAVYIWTADGKTPLPEAFSGSETRARKALGRALDKERCSDDGTASRSCFEVRRIDTILGHQQVGRFTLGGLPYEIRATGWSSHVSGYPDSIALAIYPVAQAAR
jgi:uncharacterized small protein (DUF1192 family)